MFFTFNYSENEYLIHLLILIAKSKIQCQCHLVESSANLRMSAAKSKAVGQFISRYDAREFQLGQTDQDNKSR